MAKKLEGSTREMIALRAGREIKDGDYVNLGIGIPTMVGDWIAGRDVFLQSEIGMLKTGPTASGDEVDPDLVNAGSVPIKQVPGSSFFDIVESFAMIRAGYMDVVILGALQVSERGDLANWANPERCYEQVGNIGGSMDLCAGAKRVIIAMDHTTSDGEPKILRELTFPSTARRVVDLIVTDLAVIEVTREGLVLKEIFPGLTPEDVQSVTEPKLLVSPDLKEIQY